MTEIRKVPTIIIINVPEYFDPSTDLKKKKAMRDKCVVDSMAAQFPNAGLTDINLVRAFVGIDGKGKRVYALIQKQMAELLKIAPVFYLEGVPEEVRAQIALDNEKVSAANKIFGAANSKLSLEYEQKQAQLEENRLAAISGVSHFSLVAGVTIDMVPSDRKIFLLSKKDGDEKKAAIAKLILDYQRELVKLLLNYPQNRFPDNANPFLIAQLSDILILK